MEKIPQVEQSTTPEKSRDELYFNTLIAQRDVFSSHYAMNKLRRGRKVAEMSGEDMEDYKAVKNEYDKRRELFLASLINLSQEDDKKVSELTSLTKVEIELSKLEKTTEVKTETTPAPSITPDSFDQPVAETPVRQTAEDIVGEARIHREESSESQIEKPARDMTLEEIEGKIAFAQRQTLGLQGESAEYWESQKALFLERQEAEASPDRPVPKGFMQRVRDSFEKAKDAVLGTNRISGGSESVESRMSPLGLRHEPLTPVAPNESAEAMRPEASQPESARPETIQPEAIAPQQPEKKPKKPSVWGWLKERGKGVLTFGIWEFHQAERFRSKTKEVANETKTLATLIQQERNLGLEEAEKEAWETVEELKKNNLDISAPEFYQANKDITERKKKENENEIDYIIKNAGNELVEKLAKYRGFSGEDVLTRENKLAFEADLRGELNKMRDGAMRKDFVNFAKLMRRNLDPSWYRRYIWGTTEAMWGFMGIMFVTAKIEAIAAAKLLAAEKAAGVAGSGVEQLVTQTMHENVWTTLKEMAQNGPQHLNLGDSTLQELSQKVLDSNGMYEQEWVNQAAEGLRSSRTLPEGLSLKIPVEVLKVLGY